METTDLGDEPSGATAARRALRMPGDAIGPWRVQRTLGVGSMGVVYAVRHAHTGRRAAIKVLHPRGYGDTATIERRQWLHHEARALARVSHPGIVQVRGVGELGELSFMVMELVEGATLGRWLAARRRRWPAIARVMRDVAAAVASAHAAGLIHGDIKPDNVMVARGARGRVMDFGLAEAMGGPVFEGELDEPTDEVDPGSTRRHVTLPRGTPAYMAPERISGARGNAATDQFSLCMTFYEALYGARPFRGRTPAELYFRSTHPFLRVAPAGARVPAWLHAIVTRGLAADPASRWPSLHAIIRAIDRGLGRARARRISLVGAAAALLTLAAVFAIPSTGASEASEKPFDFGLLRCSKN